MAPDDYSSGVFILALGIAANSPVTTTILLTGIHGTRHPVLGKRLVALANERLNANGSLKAEDAVRFYSIDATAWKEQGPTSFFDFLTDEQRDDLWSRAAGEIARQIEQTKPDYAIVSLHAVYYWKGRFLSSVNWDLLARLRPSVCINLVDDIFSLYWRVRTAEAREHGLVPDGEYKLSEIIAWRLRELNTSALIAKHIFVDPRRFPYCQQFLATDLNRNWGKTGEHEPIDTRFLRLLESTQRELLRVFGPQLRHYVMSVKSDLEDFFRLLLDPSAESAFLVYPISKPAREKNNSHFRTIERFRLSLRDKFVVFEPLETYEKRFHVDGTGAFLSAELTPNIEYAAGRPAVPPPIFGKAPWAIDELERVREEIGVEIRERNRRLVRQARRVFLFRPTLNGEMHPGVEDIVHFAGTKQKQILSFIPPEDRKVGMSLERYGTTLTSIDELLRRVDCSALTRSPDPPEHGSDVA